MRNKIFNLGILKEVRIDENRTPFSPAQVSNILNKSIDLQTESELLCRSTVNFGGCQLF